MNGWPSATPGLEQPREARNKYLSAKKLLYLGGIDLEYL